MRFNISTNLSNGAGLQRDFELLERMLCAAGHSVHGIMFNTYGEVPPAADVTIFVEIINPQHIAKGSQVWLIPNSEWWLPGFNGTLQYVHKVLCKTHDCYYIWSKKVGAEKCIYIGWEALDLFDGTIERKPTFLHLAGKSATKNTQAVADAWRNYRIPYQLTVASWHPHVNHFCKGVPNVRWVERFSESELVHAMNESIFHIMPSAYEGYGHAINEALGCGGIVITVDAPPMNQCTGITTDATIPFYKKDYFHEAPSYHVAPDAITSTVLRIATSMPYDLLIRQQASRSGFLADRENFRKLFGELLDA
jgi:hypothetical protein